MTYLAEFYARVTTDPVYLEEELAKDSNVSRDEIMEGMAAQTGSFARWAYAAARAEDKAKKLKHRAEKIVFSEARLRAREKGGGNKQTAADLEALANLDPEFQEAKAQQLEAEAIYELLHKAEFVLIQRRDMLQSMNSRQKEEMRGY